MGLDGGTIITRNDVLRRSSSALNAADDSRSTRGGAIRGIHRRKTVGARASKVTRWSTCALSGTPLVPPIVADFLGRLYNKAAVLELLLARAGSFADEAAEHRYLNQLRLAGDSYDHITSTRDVFPVQYTPAALTDAAPVETDTAGGADAEVPAPYSCPIAHVRCDRLPFVALATCGHVLSERALKETGGGGGGDGGSACPLCSTAYDAALDVVPLLPAEEQVERLRELLPLRRKQQKKKRKRAGGEAAAAAAAPAAAGEGAAADGPAEKAQADEQQAVQQQQAAAAAASPPVRQRQRHEQLGGQQL